MSDINVAILIVSYRCADLTIDCLRSIEAERSTPGVELRAIVVDNASGDAPPIAQAIEENHWSSWVTLIEASRNGGFAYGNNLALQRAYQDGPPDYFQLLNPDTQLIKGAVGSLVQFLEARPDVGIAGSRLGDSEGGDWYFAFSFPTILSELAGGIQFGLLTRILRRWAFAVTGAAEPRLVDWVGGASMMIRREVVDLIGGLDENYFLYFEDPDFCLRAKKAGFSTWSVPESRVMHIAGQSTGVTGHQESLKRLPTYWFESRRHYFLINHGLGYAIATDLVAFMAQGLGALKRLLQGHEGIPHFIGDLARHSVLWPRNWNVRELRTFVPAPEAGKQYSRARYAGVETHGVAQDVYEQ